MHTVNVTYAALCRVLGPVGALKASEELSQGPEALLPSGAKLKRGDFPGAFLVCGYAPDGADGADVALFALDAIAAVHFSGMGDGENAARLGDVAGFLGLPEVPAWLVKLDHETPREYLAQIAARGSFQAAVASLDDEANRLKLTGERYDKALEERCQRLHVRPRDWFAARMILDALRRPS